MKLGVALRGLLYGSSYVLNAGLRGRRILNSTAALRLAVGEGWKKPDSLGYLFAEGRMYECCRHIDKPAICDTCGYLGFAELFLLSRFNPNAIATVLGYL